MDKFNKLFLFIILIVSVISVLLPNCLFGQGHDLVALKKEYPLLMERYGNRLESRSAHYIFAIDISSSMQEYENVVRQSLATFVKAVPDGDQITLIAMCDDNNTNYVNSIKCITINSKVRQSIVSSITSPQFKFLRRGDPNDGSDGFSMTRKVLEAMNVVNSSDLTFIYLLTDFEYWTHRNKFNKAAEDWNCLKPLLTEKHTGMMCKYGIELNYNGVSHPEAIFKPELDDIFGPLDYQQANSAEILAQWFGHIINDIRAHKINAMLKADWKEYLDSVKISLQKDGRNLNAIIEAPQSDLVSGSTVTMLQGGDEYLIPTKDVTAKKGKDNLWHAEVGHYETKKTWYPSYFRLDSSDASIVVSFNSSYAEEISKLQGLCQEKAESPNIVRLNQEYALTTPAEKVWNSVIPAWLWGLIIIIVLVVAVSIALKYLQKPQIRFTNFEVKRRMQGKTQQFNGDTRTFPYSVGNGGNMAIQGVTWTLNFTTKRYNPLLNPFRKTGCYVTLEAGDFAEIKDEISDNLIETIQVGQTTLLFKYKRTPMVRIEIAEGTTTNIITIS